MSKSKSKKDVAQPPPSPAPDPASSLSLQEVEDEVKQKWNRDFRKICGQLGKDLPRLATKITVVGIDGQTLLAANFGGDRLLAMKNVLLSLLQEVDGKDSNVYKAVAAEFDAYFAGAADLQLFTSSFIDEKLTEAHPVSDILRSCTQGHFAPPSTVIQSSLGMENILSNVAHAITIRFIGSKPKKYPLFKSMLASQVVIVHRKDESAHWGATTYELHCSLSLDRPKELTTVSFRIVELDFNDSCKPELSSAILEKLRRFLHVDAQPSYGGQLSLVNASLKHFPPFLVQNKRSYLTVLHLDDNQIAAIPSGITHLSSLQVLTLTNNELTSVPTELFQLTKLWKLSLSGNKISTLPNEVENLTALRELYLSRNEFSSLPQSIVRITTLEKLSLSRNHFTLEALKPLVNLPNLNHLAINVNAFDPSKVSVEAPFDSKDDIQKFFASLSLKTRSIYIS